MLLRIEGFYVFAAFFEHPRRKFWWKEPCMIHSKDKFLLPAVPPLWNASQGMPAATPRRLASFASQIDKPELVRC